jgi:hypothetical protein
MTRSLQTMKEAGEAGNWNTGYDGYHVSYVPFATDR